MISVNINSKNSIVSKFYMYKTGNSTTGFKIDTKHNFSNHLYDVEVYSFLHTFEFEILKRV